MPWIHKRLVFANSGEEELVFEVCDDGAVRGALGVYEFFIEKGEALSLASAILATESMKPKPSPKAAMGKR
jgi:hypothetical protein